MYGLSRQRVAPPSYVIGLRALDIICLLTRSMENAVLDENYICVDDGLQNCGL